VRSRLHSSSTFAPTICIGLLLLVPSNSNALGPTDPTSPLPPPLIAPSVPDLQRHFEPITEAGATLEDRVMELVNEQRWANGQLPPLKRNELLDAAALSHSENMGLRDFFAHCDVDTKTLPWDRMQAASYNYNSAAENIAAGYSTAEAVMNGWMNSSGHRANILSTSNRELGIGHFLDPNDTGPIRRDDNSDCDADSSTGYGFNHYWTQNFGRRNAVYPVVINREAYQTETRLVQLYLYGEGWATQMRIRNDTGAWTAWEPFAAIVDDWELSPGNGTKTVSVEIRNGTQSVLSAHDTIVLEQASVSADDSLIALGLGNGGDGFAQLRDRSAPSSHATWGRFAWTGYRAAVGETRPAWCDIDADGNHELVIGLGPGSGGFVEIREDASGNFSHLRWLRVPWFNYNTANGETYVACGNVDGDDADELVVGFGPGGNGKAYIFDDAANEHRPHPDTPQGAGWVKLGLTEYATTNGSVHPAVGNLDDDAAEEIVLAVGQGGFGVARILDDAGANFAPLAETPVTYGFVRMAWPAYINDPAKGALWPAVCDLNGDGWGEIVLGAGPGGNGKAKVLDSLTGFQNATGTSQANGWVQIGSAAYNSANGAHYPTCGDLDADGRDELISGMGTFPGAGGYAQVRDDRTNDMAHLRWLRVPWKDYRDANGQVWPAVSR